MKKITFLFFLFLFFFGVVGLVGAQTWVDQSASQHAAGKDAARGWTDCSNPNPGSSGSGELNAEGYGSFNFNNSAWELAGALGGVAETNCTDNRATSFINKSVLGMSIKGVELVYANPPAGTAPFVMDTLARAGFVDKAYAQGIGYSALSPLIPIWRVFRNITYIIMIIVLVILGFMIMFRRAIDPQTVITVQSALPRVIMTMILITFSYAIAGFVIDIMYFLILLIISVFGQMGIFDASQISRVQQEFIGGGFWALLRNTFATLPKPRPGSGVGAIVGTGSLLGLVFGPLTGGVTAVAAIGSWVVAGALERIIHGGDAWSAIIGTQLSPIVYVIGLFIFAFAFIRLLFMLIKTYIQIIINVLFAPIMLIADVIPGGHGFSNWITNLIGHTLAFPITIAMILIAHAITRNADALWTPPLIPQAGGRFIESIIGVSIVFIIPSIVQSVQELFKASVPIPAGVGPVVEPITTTGRRALGLPLMYQTLVGGHLLEDVLDRTGIRPKKEQE